MRLEESRVISFFEGDNGGLTGTWSCFLEGEDVMGEWASVLGD